MEFFKALDRVAHLRLPYRIYYYNFRGNIHKRILDLPHGREQRVILDGWTSGTAPLTFRVPKGNALDALFFLIFITDLHVPEYVSHSTIRL
jgi:hypothetical protein